MLLRTTADAKVTNLAGAPVLPFQAIACCPDIPPERWPAISTGLMDYFSTFGANMFHMRLGPFYGDAAHESAWADIGGGYNADGTFNEAFFAEIEKEVAYAASKGWWVEVNVVDTWYCKHAQWGDQQMPWGQPAIDACGRTAGDPQEEAWIRKVISRLTRYGNVIWLLDNEGSEIQHAQRAWFEWERDVIRDEEKKSASNHVHLIGTNSDFVDVVDYVATHARAPLTAPIAGRWTINNERNPEFSPEQEASNFKLARDAGLVYAYWRAGMNDADAEKTLQLFKSVVDGSAQVGCFPPPSDDPNWPESPHPEQPPLLPSEWQSQMLQVVRDAVSSLGDRCGKSQIESLDTLGQKLRSEGYCADRSADGLFIKADGTYQGKPVYEEMHPYAALSPDGSSGGCATQNPYKGAWWYNGVVQVTCTGSAGPTDFISCHEAQATNHRWDCTPKYQGGPIRPEGDPERGACETKACAGTPTFSLSSASLNLVRFNDNPYQFQVKGTGGGTLNCTCPAAGSQDLCRAQAVNQ
jgi:hypothetical protein